MGKKMMGWSLALLGLGMMFMVSSSTNPSNDITCQEAITKLLPCQPFLVGSGPPKPSVSCCLAAQEVFRKANTTPIRREICECFKKAAAEFKVKPERARQIPQLCKLDGLSIPIDPNVNCTTITFF